VFDLEQLVLIFEFTDPFDVPVEFALVVGDLFFLALLHLFHHLFRRVLEIVENVLLLLVELRYFVAAVQAVFVEDVLLLEFLQVLEHGPDHGFHVVFGFEGFVLGIFGFTPVRSGVAQFGVLLVNFFGFVHAEFAHQFVDLHGRILLFGLQLFAQQIHRVVSLLQFLFAAVDFIFRLFLYEVEFAAVTVVDIFEFNFQIFFLHAQFGDLLFENAVGSLRNL